MLVVDLVWKTQLAEDTTASGPTDLEMDVECKVQIFVFFFSKSEETKNKFGYRCCSILWCVAERTDERTRHCRDDRNGPYRNSAGDYFMFRQ
jgi:hypothetical protein